MSCSIFVSYSWEPAGTSVWVNRLAARLRESGHSVALDQWDLRAGDDLMEYMETGVRESDFVLLIWTPEFANKANSGAGGVGYEKRVVTGELFHGPAGRKFIPILRSGSPAEALPSYIRSKVFVDFREDSEFDASFRELSRALVSVPSKADPEDLSGPAWHEEVAERLDAKTRLFEFATSKTDLGEAKWWAEQWAGEWLTEWPVHRLDEFFDAFEFGRASIKKSRSSAEDFATGWLRETTENEFYRYADLYNFLWEESMRSSASATERLADELVQLDDSELQVFRMAYTAARGIGKSRTEAEQMTYDEAEVDCR